MKSVQPSPCPRRGFTLVELVVVLTILVVVAGLVTVSVGGVMASSREDVTKIAFANIRAAIFGERGQGYYSDVRAMPTRIADLFRPRLDPLPVVPLFDSVTRVGWRGPYLSPQHGFYVIDVTDDLDDPDDPYGFTGDYGANGEPVPLDAWQRPIVLQIPEVDGVNGHSLEELRHARLVSAGENSGIDTPRTAAKPIDALFPPIAARGDDLILYLRVADIHPNE
ncbi:MAG: prepilin-type N-terminal cleavage/methylation domain-containing protein [Planctomycetota bacterium]